MKPIRITAGRYTGRTIRAYTLSLDGYRVQCTIGREIIEFKLGCDCVAQRPHAGQGGSDDHHRDTALRKFAEWQAWAIGLK